MPLLLRLLGALLAVAYALERGRFASVQLRWVVLAGLWGASVYNAMVMVRDGLTTARLLVIFAAILLSALLAWAHRRRYVLFLASNAPLSPAETAPAAEERLRLCGCGLFEVNEQKRYLAGVPVVFWTTRLGDHIIAAKVSAANVLGLGVPGDERGWWYAFLEPRQVVDLAGGTLYFGVSSRPALAVRYSTPKGPSLLYLTSPDSAILGRVVRALRPQ